MPSHYAALGPSVAIRDEVRKSFIPIVFVALTRRLGESGRSLFLAAPRTVASTGTSQAPQLKGRPMSDKSPRQGMTKKTGKSLKEKRADKRTKGSGGAIDDVVSKKR